MSGISDKIFAIFRVISGSLTVTSLLLNFRPLCCEIKLKRIILNYEVYVKLFIKKVAKNCLMVTMNIATLLTNFVT